MLVNVAGILDTFSSADTLLDPDWDNVIAVNLTVPVKMMRAVIPYLKQRPEGGVIVNVASTAGRSGAVAGVAYTASKHGLVIPRPFSPHLYPPPLPLLRFPTQSKLT